MYPLHAITSYDPMDDSDIDFIEDNEDEDVFSEVVQNTMWVSYLQSM
jgi:hypothetical protein